MNRHDFCGGPSLTPPGYYDLPEADEEQCHQCEKWVEVDTLIAGLCHRCQEEEYGEPEPDEDP